MDAQVYQKQTLSRPAVQGIASGIFFMAFFGAAWGFTSAGFMGGAFQIGAFILIALVTLGFFIVVGMILRYARTLPKTLSPEGAATRKRISMWFGIVFGLEFLLIALASTLLSSVQAGSFIPPAIALIVGIHFFPLARLFRVPTYYLTGALLSILALIALVALPLGLPIGGSSPDNWSLFVGIGSTVILWLTALNVTRFGLRVLRQGA